MTVEEYLEFMKNVKSITRPLTDAEIQEMHGWYPVMQNWIPVKDPLNELPKDRPLLVTVEEDGYRYVTDLYYDMTEWSYPYDAQNTIAYQDYPEPYKG